MIRNHPFRSLMIAALAMALYEAKQTGRNKLIVYSHLKEYEQGG